MKEGYDYPACMRGYQCAKEVGTSPEVLVPGSGSSNNGANCISMFFVCVYDRYDLPLQKLWWTVDRCCCGMLSEVQEALRNPSRKHACKVRAAQEPV